MWEASQLASLLMPRPQRASEGSEAGQCLGHIYILGHSLGKGENQNKSLIEVGTLGFVRSL